MPRTQKGAACAAWCRPNVERAQVSSERSGRLGHEGPTKAAFEAVESFQRMVEMTMDGPWAREFGNAREYHALREELPFLLKEVLPMWKGSARKQGSGDGT